MNLMRTKNQKSVFDLLERMTDMSSFMNGFFGFPADENLGEWSGLESLEDKYLLRTEIPGFTENEIKVEVKNNMLCVSAELNKESKDKKESWRTSNKCSYVWSIPKDVDQTKIDAEYHSGVLVVTLPKIKVDQKEIKSIPVRNSEKNQ